MTISRSSLKRRLGISLAVLMSASLAGCLSSSGSSSRSSADSGPVMPDLSEEVMLPIIFVHGFAGSGAQYESQAMRFASNGYPADRIVAFEYAGVAPHDPDQLDSFIDDVLDRFDVDQVYLIGHSMGTAIAQPTLGAPWMALVPGYQGYLADPERATKVAKLIAIDGGGRPDCPMEIPCMGIWDKTGPTAVMGENNVHIDNQAHVQVATSAESFAAQFEFLTGVEPVRTSILPEEGEVDVSGRAVFFPENVGAAGSTLRVWAVDADDGARLESEPLATFEIAADGAWGPAKLDPQAHYEIELLRPGRATHHFYRQPIMRSSQLVRLNTSRAGSDIEINTNTGEHHTALVINREKEWWTDHSSGQNDVLEVSTHSGLWGEQPAENILSSAMGDGNLAIHAHEDASTPAVSTLELLPYFHAQAFQTGVALYMPAATPPDGHISLVSSPRGDDTRQQVINVPNWASSDHRVSVTFRDWVE